MSEALSSSEIEDVLSSIRRLVSDDLRPVPKGGALNTVDAKLILTPALRVVQNDPVAEPAGAPAIEDVVASVSASVSTQADEWESETGDAAPMADAASTGKEWLLPEADADAEVGAGPDADPELALDDDMAVTNQSNHDVLTTAAEDSLPGWAQQADFEEDALRTQTWQGGTIEPDSDWADEAEAEIVQELQVADADPVLDEDEFLLNASERELPIDEEMLREVVRDILREELQGRLGERITRNIRKLVRAEIARVMASEEFL